MTFALPAPMGRALALAAEAAHDGEVPVGAVVTRGGAIIGEGANRTRRDHDPSAHAEIVAIRAACKSLGNDRLADCELWVTLEPCAMCAGAIAHARLRRLIFGAADEKAGAVVNGVRLFAQPTCHHHPEVIDGVGATASTNLLRDFFADRR